MHNVFGHSLDADGRAARFPKSSLVHRLMSSWAAAIILAAPVSILNLEPVAAQAQVAGSPIDEENQAAADAVLRAMSDYLGKTRNVTFDYNSDVEVISQGGQSSLSGLKLQFGSYGSVAMSRPDKLRASRTGG